MVSMKPARWFSAHLHVRFTAEVQWTPPVIAPASGSSANAVSIKTPVAVKNPDEIEIDFEDDEGGDGKTKDATMTENMATKNPDEIDIAFDDDDDEDETGQGDKNATETVGASAPAPAKNPDEIEISFDDEDEVDENEGQGVSTTASAPGTLTSPSIPVPVQASSQSQPSVSGGTTSEAMAGVRPHPKSTQFLALDKCEPHRQFLEIIDLPEFTGPMEFKYDEEWLSIVRTLDSFLTVGYRQTPPMEGPALDQ